MTVYPIAKSVLNLNRPEYIYYVAVDLETGQAVVIETDVNTPIPKRYDTHYKCTAVNWVKFTSLVNTGSALPMIEYTLYVQLAVDDITALTYNNLDLGINRLVALNLHLRNIAVAKVKQYMIRQPDGRMWSIELGVDNTMPMSAFSEVVEDSKVYV